MLGVLCCMEQKYGLSEGKMEKMQSNGHVDLEMNGGNKIGGYSKKWDGSKESGWR